MSPVRAAWATNYCPGAFNSADCVVDSSVDVCDGTTWATDIVCDLHYAEGASTLTAVSNYVGGDLQGGNDNDTIAAGMGDDIADGEPGDDAISGGDGDDDLDGGDGADILCGGAGTGDLLTDYDYTYENPLYDKLWDTDGSAGTCNDSSTRKGGGGVTATGCSSYALLAPPACP